jgi:hypothetical protein
MELKTFEIINHLNYDEVLGHVCDICPATDQNYYMICGSKGLGIFEFNEFNFRLIEDIYFQGSNIESISKLSGELYIVSAEKNLTIFKRGLYEKLNQLITSI